MVRRLGRLILLLSAMWVVPVAAQGAKASATGSAEKSVKLSVSLPGRTGFQKNALAEVGITLTNVSRQDIRLGSMSCSRPYLYGEVVAPSGKVLFPPAAAGETSTSCVLPSSPPIHPGKSVSTGGFLVLAAAKVRPVAQVLSGSTPVLVRGSAVTVPMYERPAVRATIHTSPVVYAHLTRAKNGLDGATYRYWYTCKTASGTLLTEVHPQSILAWDYGQGSDIHPRFNSSCVRVLNWHATAGFLFSPVTRIDDVKPFALQPELAQKASSQASAKAEFVAAFEALDAVSHFKIQQAETRLAFPERGATKGLVNENETMDYLAPDHLLATSRALNPVGKPVTQRYVQVGGVSCSLSPYNFPPHTWQAYPYDAFTYRDHRPDIGLTVMQGLRLSYSYPKNAGGHGPPQPVSSVQFTRRRGTISVGGTSVSVAIIHIHVRSSYATSFTRIRYQGRLYPPSRSDETARLTIGAATHLPILFQSTTQYTIGKGVKVLADHRQIGFDYSAEPTIEVPANTCL
jgi:hypothetical protein